MSRATVSSRSGACYRHRPQSRRGFLMVAVVVGLGVALSIMLTSVQASLRERRQMARELQMQQTRWLVDAGLARGLDKLKQDADYTGETWEVTPVLDDDQLATIEISLNEPDDLNDSRRLKVSAAIRDTQLTSQPTRHTAFVVIDAKPSNNSNTQGTSE